MTSDCKISKNAGVNTSVFKAHSSRSATSSAAVRNNCSLKDIPVYNQPAIHNILSASSNRAASGLKYNMNCMKIRRRHSRYNNVPLPSLPSYPRIYTQS